MEEKLIERLESAVSHLEALLLSGGGGSATIGGFDDAPLDPSILAYEDLIGQYLGRVSAAAEKIGGQVLDITKVLQQAFSAQNDLLIQVKQTQLYMAPITHSDRYSESIDFWRNKQKTKTSPRNFKARNPETSKPAPIF